MSGSLVPMVPLAGVAASALESYSRFLVSGRGRDRKIELERERERERDSSFEKRRRRFSGTELYLGTRVQESNL